MASSADTKVTLHWYVPIFSLLVCYLSFSLGDSNNLFEFFATMAGKETPSSFPLVVCGYG